MTSRKKIEANRANSKNSTGPIDTTITKSNALKHGLTAKGLTNLDDPEMYEEFREALTKEYKPDGAVQAFLVSSAALDAVRWKRAQMLEASFIVSTQNPPVYQDDWLKDFEEKIRGKEIKAGVSPALRVGDVDTVMTFQRYETYFSNRFYRTIHELERQQRMRRGENLPAPLAINVNVQTEQSPRLETETSKGPILPPPEDTLTGSGTSSIESSEREFAVTPLGADNHQKDNETVAAGTQHSEVASSLNLSNDLNKTYEVPPAWHNVPPKPAWGR